MSNPKEKLIKCFNNWLEQNPILDNSNYNMLTFLIGEGVLEEKKIKEYVKDEKDRIIEDVLYKYDYYCARVVNLSNRETTTIEFYDEEYIVFKDDAEHLLTLIKLLKGEK